MKHPASETADIHGIRRYGTVILIAATALVFAGGLHFPMLKTLDDWAYVSANSNLGFSPDQLWALITEPVLNLYTPLPMLTYLADYALGGMDPFWYHLQNLLWHLGTVLLVRHWFRQLGCNVETAFFAALCFAIHPQRVESVVWIAERKDVCFAFFFLLTLVLQERTRQAEKSASPASGAAMLAALFCKPAAIVLPGILMFLEWRRTRQWSWKTQCRQLLWHGAAAGIWLLFSTGLFRDAAGHAGRYGLRPWTALRNGFLYPLRTLIPADLMPVHPFFEPSLQDQILMISGVVLMMTGCGILWRFQRQFFIGA
ncbi:MAG: hypothetical protein J6R85_05660, partial [Lentisphaeria bacterium]|nr:hypothetical protein [Lentisphaeria bacterium]